jgi:hypothetical protein
LLRGSSPEKNAYLASPRKIRQQHFSGRRGNQNPVEWFMGSAFPTDSNDICITILSLEGEERLPPHPKET